MIILKVHHLSPASSTIRSNTKHVLHDPTVNHVASSCIFKVLCLTYPAHVQNISPLPSRLSQSLNLTLVILIIYTTVFLPPNPTKFQLYLRQVYDPATKNNRKISFNIFSDLAIQSKTTTTN